mgnify:CR=1 FL=1
MSPLNGAPSVKNSAVPFLPVFLAEEEFFISYASVSITIFGYVVSMKSLTRSLFAPTSSCAAQAYGPSCQRSYVAVCSTSLARRTRESALLLAYSTCSSDESNLPLCSRLIESASERLGTAASAKKNTLQRMMLLEIRKERAAWPLSHSLSSYHCISDQIMPAYRP